MFANKSNFKTKLKKILIIPFKIIAWPFVKTVKWIYPKNSLAKVRLLVAAIFIFSLLAGFFDYPLKYNQGMDWVNSHTGLSLPHFFTKPFKQGLDLQGGTHLVYQANLSEINSGDRTDAMDGVRDVIERRVNSLGVSEPLVQVMGKDRLVVELAGVLDVNDAIRQIGETPLLEFKEQPKEDKRELTVSQKKEMDDFNVKAKDTADKIIAELKKGGSFEDLAKQYSEDAFKDSGGDWGWKGEDVLDKAVLGKIEEVKDAENILEPIENEKDIEIFRRQATREEKELVETNHLLICYKGADGCKEETTKEEARAQIEDLKKQATVENFTDLAKKYSTEPGAKDRAGYLGNVKKGMLVPEFEKVLFAMKDQSVSDVVETKFGFHLIYRKSHRYLKEYKLGRIVINKKTRENILPPQPAWIKTDLSGAQLDRAEILFNQQTGDVQVALKFDGEGTKMFKEITQRNVGKPLAIFLDGSPISIPRVNEPILNGDAVITGNFSIDEGKLLVQRLNAGALPVPIDLLSQQTIGASLGKESVAHSLKAGMVGLLLVCLFMVLYYRLPGVIAVVSLLLYGIFTLALFKLVGVTLTLSGIAGFILSIGMAVDANVLIFERLKEELKIGKTLVSAIDEAFKRAWTSIRDGNLSTLITCLILAWFGTSFIKGFAITLILGVSMSMFSAIYITKNILKLVVATFWGKVPFLYLGGASNKEK